MRFCDGTMLIWMRQFNLKSGRWVAAVLALAFLDGCQTDKNASLTAVLRVHLEVTVPSATSQNISVLRASPVMLTILKDPVLSEANIMGARLIDTQGGFAVQIAFDDRGIWMLEQYTASNPSKHFAIHGQWGTKLSEARWLAAPMITKRVDNGTLTFTADMSRAEAEQLVRGLNNVAKKNHKSPGLLSP